MIKFMSTTAILVSAASIVYAGSPEPMMDMEVHPVAASVTDWSGFYAGGSYSFETSEMYTIEMGRVSDDAGYNGVGSETTFSAEASSFGLYAGKNWQNNALVFGLEGAVGTSGFNESVTINAGDTFAIYEGSLSAKISGRVGFAAGQFLVYGTAGLSALNGTFGVLDEAGVTVDTRTSTTLTGLSYGGGVEFMTPSNWAIRVEYTVADYGDFSTIGLSPGNGDFQWDHSINTQSITLGVAKHF